MSRFKREKDFGDLALYLSSDDDGDDSQQQPPLRHCVEPPPPVTKTEPEENKVWIDGWTVDVKNINSAAQQVAVSLWANCKKVG
jgi:hypothetical protein